MVFDAPRPLPYPLYYQAGMEVETPEGETACGLPEFPEDSDEKITVLFRLSLNEFVKLASVVDIGSDIGYGADGLKIWWLWVANIMCASFCEEMATCFNDQNEALMTAVAAALTSNPLLLGAISDALTKQGSAVPGRALSPTQSASDILPMGVRDEFGDCIDDALWGACLYLVQSGNRAITDFFEILELASNTLEASGIVAQNIPAAGSYAASAFEFADQLLENFQEGYAASYTEEYEADLACAIFCAAREGCSLTPDMLVNIMEVRQPDFVIFLTFEAVMNYFGAGTFVTATIADAMFAIYFAALKFGQQFGDVLGLRPLTDLMGLGADQLASDNWESLCDCGTADDFTVSQYAEYSGGSPISVQPLEFGEYEFDATDETTPGRFTLRLEFSPQVKITVVSTDWVFADFILNPMEAWLDYTHDAVTTDWNAPGYGDNTSLPYQTLENVPVNGYTRLYAQNGAAFSVVLLIEADV